MRIILFTIFFISMLFSNNTLKIGVVPWQTKDDFITMYKPLFKLIEDKTGKKIEFIITKNYSQLSKRMLVNNIDIGIFGANSYIIAKDKNPNLVYLGTPLQPTAKYNALILSRKDSNIKTINDLKHKTFAFSDFASTSGYVYPKIILEKENFSSIKNFKSVTMLGSHYKVYEAIANGKIDAGACSSTRYKEAVEKYGDIFYIIKKSESIPQDAITANPYLKKEFINKLKNIFKNANQSGYFQKFPSKLKGVVIEDDSFYDNVRKMIGFNPN